MRGWGDTNLHGWGDDLHKFRVCLVDAGDPLLIEFYEVTLLGVSIKAHSLDLF
jgi:hypothetical protein